MQAVASSLSFDVVQSGETEAECKTLIVPEGFLGHHHSLCGQSVARKADHLCSQDTFISVFS